MVEVREGQRRKLLHSTASIIARHGTTFGGGSPYVCLGLIKTQDDFDLLIRKITTLGSNEDGFKTM